MENEELIRRRFQDMARRAYNRNIVVCSDFLDLHELHNLQYLNMDDLGVKLRLSGGYEEAERQIAAFLPDAFVYFEEDDFPIRCIAIRPLNDKFSEELTHRDYLGALMHLGIERSCQKYPNRNIRMWPAQSAACVLILCWQLLSGYPEAKQYRILRADRCM